MTTSIKKLLPALIMLLMAIPAMASHFVGYDMTYTYDGEEMHAGTNTHKYTVRLTIYEDCQNGQPEAIAQDNPAYFSVYKDIAPYTVVQIDSVQFISSTVIPAIFNSTPCGHADVHNVCLLRKEFVKTYYLVPNANGYVVSYQRCCRNNAISNIATPGDAGVTCACYIPPIPLVNNSAVFRNYPEQLTCMGQPYYFDHSATDVDGDSLSYGFCAAIVGASDADIKPIPLPPPYSTVTYVGSASAQAPVSGTPDLSIDAATGMITGKPNQPGRYLVTVRCYEWRSGVQIDSVTRDFELVVMDCGSSLYTPFAGNDTTIFVGDSANFYAYGAATYLWTPATYLTNPNIPDPVGHFPVPGHFTYTLHATSDSGCNGTAERHIWVIEHTQFLVPGAFTPNNDGLNDYLVPLPVYNCTMLAFRVFDRWGRELFMCGDYCAWDGTYKGKKQDGGVYMWEITYRDNNGVERKQHGNVTLLR